MPWHPLFHHGPNPQRLQPSLLLLLLLPPHGAPSPIHPLHPADRLIEPQRLEQLDIDIDALLVAAHARVDNLDVWDRLLVVGVVDANGGAAERVGVGVGAVVHHEVRDGDDGLAGRGGHVARGSLRGVGGGVEGHVARVGGGEGDGDGEGEGGEGEGAGFHFFWRIGVLELVVSSLLGIRNGELVWRMVWDVCGWSLGYFLIFFDDAVCLSGVSFGVCVRELFIQKGVVQAKGDGSIDGDAWELLSWRRRNGRPSG